MNSGCENCPAYAKCTVTYRGSSCAAALRRSYGIDDDPKTNADRIRSMSDKELAREMLFFVPSDFNRHYTGIAGGYYATADEAIQANFDWLKQPAKEEYYE